MLHWLGIWNSNASRTQEARQIRQRVSERNDVDLLGIEDLFEIFVEQVHSILETCAISAARPQCEPRRVMNRYFVLDYRA
jgi:hypothetical protein